MKKNKSEAIRVRVYDDDKTKYIELAKSNGMKLGTYIRHLLEREVASYEHNKN